MTRPVAFAEANGSLAAPPGMADCESLPVYEEPGLFISCWRLSLRERLGALVFGTLWLQVRGTSHPPVAIQVERRGFD